MMNHEKIASEAIELVAPAIDNLFKQTCRQELHIVVMDPRKMPWDSEFEEAILIEKSFGNPSQWQVPFNDLARLKAKQAWRDRTANINHQTMHPSSLQSGDVLYYGSFVYGNIVVACSGVEQWFDMLVSGWIALAFEQLAMHEYQKSKLENPTKPRLD